MQKNWLLATQTARLDHILKSHLMAVNTRKHASEDVTYTSNGDGDDTNRPIKRSKQDVEDMERIDNAEIEEDDEDEYGAGRSEPSKASDLYLDTVCLFFMPHVRC